MLLIGLTGPSGAGKGAFCRILRQEYGIESIDADEVYHALLVPPSPCLDLLSDTFGTGILNQDGTLDRKKLASIVFSPDDPAIREKRISELNGITHYFVLSKADELLREAEKAGVKAMVFDAPALYESGADKWCDLIVAVTAKQETRLRRIIARDGLSKEAAERRIRSQHPDAFYTEKATAVLHNDGSEEAFESAIHTFYREYLSDRIPKTSSEGSSL